jgi:mitogen-activated protein kinase 1/3
MQPSAGSKDFFSEYGETNRYAIREIIGKGSYGVVCSATDNYTGERVAIKKITNVFEHVSDATRILREIKLLRLLKHPGVHNSCGAAMHVGMGRMQLSTNPVPADIVDIKHIMLPPSAREFKDIYVVFELMETDLHQVAAKSWGLQGCALGPLAPYQHGLISCR